MGKGIFLTGTDSGVGKTFIAGGLARVWSQSGKRVGVMKPIESGCVKSESGLQPQDALFLKEMSHSQDELDLINPYRFEQPLSPSVAADLEGLEIDFKKIEKIYMQLAATYQLTLVEGAGGLLSPLYKNFTNAELIGLLEIPVVVVARDALGTINHTLLTVEYARSQGIHVLGVIINTLSATPDPSTKTNAQVIKRLSGVSLLGVVPYLATPERYDLSSIAKHVGEHVDTALLIRHERC